MSVKTFWQELVGWTKFVCSIPYIIVVGLALVYVAWDEKRTRAAQWKQWTRERDAIEAERVRIEQTSTEETVNHD